MRGGLGYLVDSESHVVVHGSEMKAMDLWGSVMEEAELLEHSGMGCAVHLRSAVLSLLLHRLGKEAGNGGYLDAARKGRDYLMTVTRRNGIVDFSQGDTKGIGYYSTRYEHMPFTQGITLLLALETQEETPS